MAGEELKTEEIDATSVVEDINNLILTEEENYWYQHGSVIYHWNVDKNGTLTSVNGLSDEEMKEIVIPMVINGQLVTALGNNVFKNKTSINTISIPNTVTSIGESCFSGCTGLTDVTIPNSLTSIGESCFSGCTGLTDVTIPNSVTTISKNCFDGCTNIASITIPEGVTVLEERAFNGCTNLNNINLPTTLKTIGIGCFNNCTNLTSITIPEGITTIESETFSGCENLSEVILPNSLTTINAYAFLSQGGEGLSNLREIYIPENVTYIATNDFYVVDGEIHNVIQPGAFFGNNTNINVDENNKVYSSEDGVLFNKDKTELLFFPTMREGTYTIPSTVKTIKDCAFSYSQLTEITIPENVETIGLGAFCYCNIEKFNIEEGLKNIEMLAFSNCYGFTDILIPNSVTHMAEYIFDNHNTLLENIYFAAGNNPIPEGAPWGASSGVNIEKLTQ